MKVNLQVEPLVREALGSAVNRDGGRFSRALGTLVSYGEPTLTDANNLTLAICLFALFDVHRGLPLNQSRVDFLAREFVVSEQWTGLDEGVVRDYLTALTDPNSVEDAVAELNLEGTGIGYVVAAWLLAAFLRGGKPWYDYLDDILDSLESLEGRS